MDDPCQAFIVRADVGRGCGSARVLRGACCSIVPLRDRFSIDVQGGDDMEAKGNIVDHEYKIERGRQKVAEVSKRWFRVRDTTRTESTLLPAKTTRSSWP